MWGKLADLKNKDQSDSSAAHSDPSFCSRQVALVIFLFFVRVGSKKKPTPRMPPKPRKLDTGQPTLFTYQIMAEHPHDSKAFTQGLEYDEVCDKPGGVCRQVFWESTGLNGQSTVREVEVTTGKVLRSHSLPSQDFGEGVTRLGDSLYQVTWQSSKAWKYSVSDFEDATELQVRRADLCQLL